MSGADNTVSKAFEKEVVNTFSLYFQDFFRVLNNIRIYNIRIEMRK